MNQKVSNQTRMQIGEAPDFLDHLIQALQLEFSLDKNEVVPLLSQGFSFECVQCAIRLSGEELFQLTQPLGESPEGNPKISRIQQGYCARNGCASQYYHFHFYPVTGLDWETVCARAADLAEQRKREAKAYFAGLKSQTWKKRRRQVLHLMAGLAIIGILLFARHWRNGGAVPFIRELDELQIDPASLPTGGICLSCGQRHDH